MSWWWAGTSLFFFFVFFYKQDYLSKNSPPSCELQHLRRHGLPRGAPGDHFQGQSGVWSWSFPCRTRRREVHSSQAICWICLPEDRAAGPGECARVAVARRGGAGTRSWVLVVVLSRTLHFIHPWDIRTDRRGSKQIPMFKEGIIMGWLHFPLGFGVYSGFPRQVQDLRGPLAFGLVRVFSEADSHE